MRVSITVLSIIAYIDTNYNVMSHDIISGKKLKILIIIITAINCAVHECCHAFMYSVKRVLTN